MVLVMDNLNTHKLACLYEAFEPEQARRIAERLEVHYTPKHGQLAERGGDRVERADPAVPGPADRVGGGAAARRWSRGRTSGTSGRSGSTGGSPPPTPGSSSADSTPQSNSGGLLVVFVEEGCPTVPPSAAAGSAQGLPPGPPTDPYSPN